MPAVTLNPARKQAEKLNVEASPTNATRGSRPVPTGGRFADLDVDSTVSSRTYLESGGFRAVTSLGAIAPGHTLIVPTVDVREATAAYSVLDFVTRSGSHKGLEASIEAVLARLRDRYGPFHIIFEHGGLGKEYTSMCGTCFPHLHVLPTAHRELAFRSSLQRSCRFMCDYIRDFNSPSDFYRDARGDGEYLLACDGTGVSVLWSGRHLTFPSQVIRHVAQECMGLPRDRWQDNPDLEGAVAVANALRG